MLGGIVMQNREIELRFRRREVTLSRQGNAHNAMSGHERDGRALFLSER
jgi:hypothetical protein